MNRHSVFSVLQMREAGFMEHDYYIIKTSKQYARDDAECKVFLHIEQSRNGAFIGQHSWINTNKDVLFDKKCKFRALKSWGNGYIKPYTDNDDIEHIAITEV